ncbi:leucine-rich repeat transmembrane neuronal protein 1-like [Acanthaster planci]|uniref:Leucine-rich repeat transmembrane neuronal protein 1-like n=1 Tax=Acanthaster planci TaxID=133434 RepID=A0A8B7YT86_ACAPL|nr:leucine-rich repeat transmembrane neuronal protein 1-like [Acanthaster planci]
MQSGKPHLRRSVVCVLSQMYLFFMFSRLAAACPVRCHCRVGGEVNCTEANMRRLPSSDMLSNTHILYLGSNFISSLYEDYFQDLSELRQLHLAQNRISRLPDYAFRPLGRLEVLDLRFNMITQISEYAFDGLVSVVVLNLAGNRIESISGDAFDGMRSMEVLNLGDNNLRVSGLPQNLFQGAQNLKWLDLGSSELKTMPHDLFTHENRAISLDMPSLFNSLHRLEILIIEGCKLQYLEPRSFAGTINLIDLRLGFNALKEALPLTLFETSPHLRRIQLQNNSLTHLHERLFDSIDDLEYVELLNNPWHCSCGLLGLRARWSKQPRAFLQTELVCQSPELFSGRELWDISLHELYTFCASGIEHISTITAIRDDRESLQSLDCPVYMGTKHIVWLTPSADYITSDVEVSNNNTHQHRLLENGSLSVDSIQLGTYICVVTLSNGSYHVGGVQVDTVPLKSPGPPEIPDGSKFRVLSAFIVLLVLGIIISTAWATCRIRQRSRRNRFSLLSKEHALIDMRPPAEINTEGTDYDYDYAYAHPRTRIHMTTDESAYAVGRLWEEQQLNSKSLVPRIRPISRSMHERGPKYYNDCVRPAVQRTSHTISTGEVNGYITPSQISACKVSVRSWTEQVKELKRAGRLGDSPFNGVSSEKNTIRPDSSDTRYLEIM